MTGNKSQTRKILTDHVNTYPALQIQDIFKLLFQSAFGCEHLVSDTDGAIAYIESEYKTVPQEPRAIEPLGGEYSRVPLSYMNNGLTADTLGKIFVLSAKREENGISNLESKLKTAMELIVEGVLPFDAEEFDAAVNEWRALGYPSVRHSEIFRSKYRPSYRVISNEFVPFLPILTAIDKLGDKAASAIDIGSASDKTALAYVLEKVYGSAFFRTGDIFCRPQSSK